MARRREDRSWREFGASPGDQGALARRFASLSSRLPVAEAVAETLPEAWAAMHAAGAPPMRSLDACWLAYSRVVDPSSDDHDDLLEAMDEFAFDRELEGSADPRTGAAEVDHPVDVAALARRLGVEPEHLDEAVHDAYERGLDDDAADLAGEDAASVNNQGLDEQIKALTWGDGDPTGVGEIRSLILSAADPAMLTPQIRRWLAGAPSQAKGYVRSKAVERWSAGSAEGLLVEPGHPGRQALRVARFDPLDPSIPEDVVALEARIVESGALRRIAPRDLEAALDAAGRDPGLAGLLEALWRDEMDRGLEYSSFWAFRRRLDWAAAAARRAGLVPEGETVVAIKLSARTRIADVVGLERRIEGATGADRVALLGSRADLGEWVDNHLSVARGAPRQSVLASASLQPGSLFA